jgi:Holliday junction resolvase
MMVSSRSLSDSCPHCSSRIDSFVYIDFKQTDKLLTFAKNLGGDESNSLNIRRINRQNLLKTGKFISLVLQK